MDMGKPQAGPRKDGPDCSGAQLMALSACAGGGSQEDRAAGGQAAILVLVGSTIRYSNVSRADPRLHD